MNLFPFTAIVGLDDAKQALLYHAIDPRLGGVLLLGHRGCAKSTLVRAFAAMLETEEGTPAPFCEVPLGVTEDRLLGSVDAQTLVERQRWQSRVGLLEKANKGILYIDEINLLSDHLSDLILDSAASGVHRIERDGIARAVASRYILVGTMNPEEGELRPQLLDRFAHGVRIQDNFTEDERMKIVQSRMRFDDDPTAFIAHYQPQQDILRKQIYEARIGLTKVSVTDEQRREIARYGRELNLEGMRTELAVTRTARAAAAWRGRSEVVAGDLEEAWTLCLGHRLAELQPKSPEVPPRPSHMQRPWSAGSQNPEGGTSSPAPVDSRFTEVRVKKEIPPQVLSEALNAWWSDPFTPAKKRAYSGDFVDTRAQGPLVWYPSLLLSSQRGWLSGQGTFQICRSQIRRKRALWIFLDASRSTGMSGFLSRAISLLTSGILLKSASRMHLLLVHENRVRWLCRNQRGSRVQEALGTISSASGGSHLAEGLVQLNRSILRQRNHTSSTLLVTDGLNRRRPNETVKQSSCRMHLGLKRLQEATPHLAWCHPKSSLGRATGSDFLFSQFQRVRIPV